MAGLQDLADVLNKTQDAPVETPVVQEQPIVETPAVEVKTEGKEAPTQATETKQFIEIPDNFKQKEVEQPAVQTPAPQQNYAHETIKFLNDYIAETGQEPTPELFYDLTINYDKYDTENILHAKELLFKEQKIKNPNLSDEKIRKSIDYDYKGLRADVDDEEYSESALKLSVAAESAKNALKERQGKLKFPEKKNQEILRQQAEQKEKQVREHLSNIFEETVKDFKGVDYKIGDEEFKIEFAQEQLKPIKQLFTNPASLVEAFNTPKGFDYEGLANFYIKGLYADQMMNAAVKQAEESAKLKYFTERENADLGKSIQTPTTTKTTQSDEFTKQVNQKLGKQGAYKIPIV